MEKIEKQVLKNIRTILKTKPIGNVFVGQSEQAKAVADWLYVLINIEQYKSQKNTNNIPNVTYTPYYSNGYYNTNIVKDNCCDNNCTGSAPDVDQTTTACDNTGSLVMTQ